MWRFGEQLDAFGGGGSVNSNTIDADARTAFVLQLKSAGVGAEAAEKEATRRYGPAGSGAVIPSVDAKALEKHVEHAGDVLMQKLGFEVVRFSHPGKTQQTIGIPDRRYYRRPRLEQRADGQFLTKPLVVWVEYKSASGEPRPGQDLFREMAEACGEEIVVGGVDELARWLLAKGFAVEPRRSE